MPRHHKLDSESLHTHLEEIRGNLRKKIFPSFELLLKIAYALEVHPADLFLRNASKNREEIRDFFDNELSITIKEMIEERFPKEK